MARTTWDSADTPAPDDDVRWLDDTEMRAWRAYVDTVGPLAAVLGTDLAPHGLTDGDYEVLVWLSDVTDGQMRMCDLADRLRLSPSGLTRRLDGLVSSGLVRRVPSVDDRRVMLAELTPTGRRHLERAAPDHLRSVRRHFVDLLTTEELKHLASAFDKVRRHLRGEQNASS